MAEKNAWADGFALPYSKKVGDFRFYFMSFSALMLFAGFFWIGHPVFLGIALAAATVAYYFYPLVEKKPRIGANQYGIFIDGFGVIAWRAISDISLRTYAVRSIENTELHIKLAQPLAKALIADWRRLPLWRLLMKLPWTMTHENVVRIKLEPFAPDGEQILTRLERMRRFFG